MAKLQELRTRTESIVRRAISPTNYLLWANECLEDLSEIAKLEAKPLIFILDGNSYEYIITKDDGRYIRKNGKNIVSGFEYFDYDGKKVAVNWDSKDEVLGNNIVINGIKHTTVEIKSKMILSGVSYNEPNSPKGTIFTATVDRLVGLKVGDLVTIYSKLGTLQYDSIKINYIDTQLNQVVFELVKDGGDVIVEDTNYFYAPSLKLYRKPYVIGTSYDYYDLDGKYIETFDSSMISDVLKVDKDSITLPKDYQEVVKVELWENDLEQKIRQISFQDDATHYDFAFYEGEYPRKLNFTKNIKGKICVYYYKELPKFDIDNDIIHFDMLEVPFKETRFHNLINYYCVTKYFESWQDEKAIETISIFTAKYEELKSDFDDSVERRHAKNTLPRTVVATPWK